VMGFEMAPGGAITTPSGPDYGLPGHDPVKSPAW